MNQNLLAGVSGGPDSIRMWVFLNQSYELGAGKFSIITCNHGWQKSNFVLGEEIARLSFLDKKCFHFISTPRCLDNENTARRWRRAVFVRLVKLKAYSKLVLGHNLSDWIETFLIYLFRGHVVSIKAPLVKAGTFKILFPHRFY